MVFFTDEKQFQLAVNCGYLYQTATDIDDIFLAMKGMYLLTEYDYLPAVEFSERSVSNLRNHLVIGLFGDSG